MADGYFVVVKNLTSTSQQVNNNLLNNRYKYLVHNVSENESHVKLALSVCEKTLTKSEPLVYAQNASAEASGLAELGRSSWDTADNCRLFVPTSGNSIEPTAQNIDFAALKSRRKRRHAFKVLRHVQKTLLAHPRADAFRYRTSNCMRALADLTATVNVQYCDRAKKSRFHNYQTCESPHLCPVCSMVIMAKRASDFVTRFKDAEYEGSPVHFLYPTYTVQHNRSDSLQSLWDLLKKAVRSMRQTKSYKAFCDRFGILGYIDNYEIRHSPTSGWHPHIHQMLVMRRRLAPDELSELRRWIYKNYTKTLVKAGKTVNEHTLDVLQPSEKGGSAALQKYICKWAGEMSGGQLKQSKGDSVTPFELATACVADGDNKAGALFSEYAGVTLAQRQMTKSQSIDKLFPVPDDDTSEGEFTEESIRILLRLFKAEARRLSDKGLHAQLLEVGDRGDPKAVRDFALEHRIILLAELHLHAYDTRTYKSADSAKVVTDD